MERGQRRDLSFAATSVPRRTTSRVFSSARARRSLFRYRPGQFITLELEIDGEPINRCYTLSSTPTRPDTISITVKRATGGKVSNWLHDNLKPGMEIKALGPAGDFSCTLRPAAKYLFLSGGSGVTPLMSMSRTYYDLGEDGDIVFVHSARTPRDIIFRRELAAMTNGMATFARLSCASRRATSATGARRPATCRSDPEVDRPRFRATRDLLLRAGALHGGRARHAEGRRLRHGALPRGELLVRAPGRPPVEGRRDKAAAARRAGPGFKIEFTRLGRIIELRPGPVHSRCGAGGGHAACRFPAPRACAAPARRRSCRAMSS